MTGYPVTYSANVMDAQGLYPTDTRRASEQELCALLAEFERPIYAYLRSLLHDDDVAQDCTQETFIRAYQSLCSGKDIHRQWLYRVARNCAMDEFRRRRKMQRESTEVSHGAEQDRVEECLTVQQALNQLPPIDRNVLYLFGVAGFKTDEIAGILGLKGATVRQRLCRARGKFKSLYAIAS